MVTLDDGKLESAANAVAVTLDVGVFESENAAVTLCDNVFEGVLVTV